ncbi:MAG: hypothetical protein ABFS38_14265 [Bacteroidota bacterium]
MKKPFRTVNRVIRANRIFLFFMALSMGSCSLGFAQGIRPYGENPFYWEFRGKPCLLVGGSVDDDLFQVSWFEPHLDTLVACGGNYIRNTMSPSANQRWPFGKKDGKYDMTTLNPEYWFDVNRLLHAASERDIVVQIEVWSTFSYYRDTWTNHNPFNPVHNINYTVEESGLPVENSSHPTRADNPFFRTVPEYMNNTVVLAFQQKYVDKLLSITMKYDNVLFSMDNETSVDARWGAYWAGYIQEAYKAEGKIAYVTEMWDPWDLTHEWHLNTIDHPETYNFVEVSQNTWQEGQRQRDRLHYVRHRLIEKQMVRPINNVKIYTMRAGNRYLTPRLAVNRMFVHLWGGVSAVRFHRPTSPGHGIGLDQNAQRAIRGIREVFKKFDIFKSEPNDRLLGERAENEAYCLAQQGKQWALYFPASGAVILRASGAPEEATFRVQWYDLDYLAWRPAYELKASDNNLPLGCPEQGRWVAIVTVKE